VSLLQSVCMLPLLSYISYWSWCSQPIDMIKSKHFANSIDWI
jgi:hypothetical protein